MMRCWLGLCVLVVWVAWTGGVAHAAPHLDVIPDSPPAVDFESVRVNNAATPHTVTKSFVIRNNGNGNPDLNVTGVTFSNSDYRLNPAVSFPLMLAPLAEQAITVEFNPSATGTRTATMTVASSNAGSDNVDLTGFGTAAVIAVPDTIDYDIVHNGVALSQDLAISNSTTTSQGPLTVTSATITGSTFFRFSNTLGCSGGTACTFTPPLVITSSTIQVPVICQPPAAASGPSMGMVTFTSDSDAGGVSTTTVTCTAGRSNIAVSASSLNFTGVAVGQTLSKTVTITNNGNTALTYSLAEVPNVAQFAITAGCTSSCLVPPPPTGNTATFTLTFTPNSPAEVTTRIDISNDDPDPGDNVKQINITGTGDQGVLATVPASPTALDFGGVPQGSTKTLPFTLKNIGNVMVTGIIAQIGNPGLGFQIVSTVPSSLAPAEQVTLNAQFAPPIGNAGGATSFTVQGSWTADTFTAASSAALNVTGVGQPPDTTSRRRAARSATSSSTPGRR